MAWSRLDEPELKVELLLPQLIERHWNRHPLCEQSIAIFKCASDCGETILEHLSLGVGQLQPIKEFQAPGRGTVAGFKSRHAEDLRSQISGRGRVPTMGAARGDPLAAFLAPSRPGVFLMSRRSPRRPRSRSR